MKYFITNSNEKKLKDRIVNLISESKELKFLVGFFYFSGISELIEALKNNNEVILKILVGLDVDQTIHGIIEYGDNDKLSRNKVYNKYLKSLAAAINSDECDEKEFYLQVKFYIDLIINKKLIIRKTSEPNHAKLYLFKIKDDKKHLIDSCFITGSSNLTRAGLLSQHEFNVEIKDYGTDISEQYFDVLWNQADAITEDDDFRVKLINYIKQETLIAEVTPFEAYALVLKNYIDTLKQKKLKQAICELLEERGYQPYRYQLDAVSQALSIIENYNGVIIADVVGLGKSIIAGLIARSMWKRGVIICPPGLIGDDNKLSGWKKYVEDFKLYDWEIRSLGLENLKKTLEYVNQNEEFEVIIIDEVHRFRNQDTEAYNILKNICQNKKVIMLSATPFNNSPSDIFSLLKLFIIPGKSNITLENDLDNRFRSYNITYQKLAYINKNYRSTDKQKKDKAITFYESLFGSRTIEMVKVRELARHLSNNIRSVLEPVVIRRNRIDLRNDPDYSQEVYNLSDVDDPHELYFELSEKQSSFYDRVINDYFGEDGLFKGAIYRPYLYEVGSGDIDDSDVKESFERQSQTNLFHFMRRLLVKRFESSFGSFEQSIKNFININEMVLKFIENSNGKYILDRRLMDKIYESDLDDIEEKLSRYEQDLATSTHSSAIKVYNVHTFQYKNDFIRDIKTDIKLFNEILNELQSLQLVENDPKVKSLVKMLKEILNKKQEDGEPKRKVVIFTEYADTAKYLEKRFLENENIKDKFLSVYGSLPESKIKIILENFDASSKRQIDNYDILLGTDKISEGFNLNRAGAIINFDIPWNPTRVIQRVGRINRIGNKVFNKLYIYNAFPTVQGADIIKSKEIAAHKMFLIHNTLGEDSKIFEPEEEPSPAGLFNRVMENPESFESESFHTTIRKKYAAIEKDYPEVIQKISLLPPRIKVAKRYKDDNLVVFFKKALGFFVRCLSRPMGDIDEISFIEAIEYVECEPGSPSVKLSDTFWERYKEVKEYKRLTRTALSEQSIETRARNVLWTLINSSSPLYDPYKNMARNIIEDITEYKTISDYTIRKISNIKIDSSDNKIIKVNLREFDLIYTEVGDDYIDKIKNRIEKIKDEVIIAVENIK